MAERWRRGGGEVAERRRLIVCRQRYISAMEGGYISVLGISVVGISVVEGGRWINLWWRVGGRRWERVEDQNPGFFKSHKLTSKKRP